MRNKPKKQAKTTRCWLLEAVIDFVLPVFIGRHNGAENPNVVLHKKTPKRTMELFSYKS